MAGTWDVFHAETLEAERGLTTAEVRRQLARGDLRDDDLIRPSGTSQPWIAIADCAPVHQAEPAVESPPAPPSTKAKPPSPPLEPLTEAGTAAISGSGTGRGTRTDEMATEFISESEEFGASEAIGRPNDDSGSESGDDLNAPENETRFFQGMLEDEFDVLNDDAVAFPKGTTFGLGPSEDELDAQSAGFPRNDGKVRDEPGSGLGLDLKNLGSQPKHKPRSQEPELETWDDGEPTGSVNLGPGPGLSSTPAKGGSKPHFSAKLKPVEEPENESSLEFIDDEDSDDDAILLELSVEVEAAEAPNANLNADADAADEIDEFPVVEEYDPIEEEEAAAEFTLARGSAETVEELDLAAMVDVAFQLVLFFLVTATTVLYKSLEVPKPNPETSAPASATQGKSLDELKNDFILVEIDPAGLLKIDQEPVDANVEALVRRLRSAREETGRQSMLLSADFATPHRSAVLAYDAANEIGLGIAIARPQPKPSP